MGKKKSGGGGTKTKTSSGGMRHIARAKKTLRRILMKVARWERNKDNPEKVPKRNKKQKQRKTSRHNNWDTSGLLGHATLLEAIVASGRKTG